MFRNFLHTCGATPRDAHAGKRGAKEVHALQLTKGRYIRDQLAWSGDEGAMSSDGPIDEIVAVREIYHTAATIVNATSISVDARSSSRSTSSLIPRVRCRAGPRLGKRRRAAVAVLPAACGRSCAAACCACGVSIHHHHSGDIIRALLQTEKPQRCRRLQRDGGRIRGDCAAQVHAAVHQRRRVY